MASDLALQRAAQAWCDETTAHITMDERLAKSFANILDDVWSKPWLGNATTGQLLEEIRVRIEVHGNGLIDYKTVSDEPQIAS